MICPKCSTEVSDKTPRCPKCNKVLLHQCPLCKTLNEDDVCKKCGFTIITVCKECEKRVQTIKGKCKCGQNTFASALAEEANSEDYGVITLEFTNLDEIKAVFGNNKLFEKFKLVLDGMVRSFADDLGLRREKVGDFYIIRFLKEYSFSSSAQNTMKSAIELLNEILQLNFKFNKSKGTTIHTKFTLLKRNVEATPKDWASGLNIKLISQNPKEYQLLNNMQMLIDGNIQEHIENDYSVSGLNSVMVNGQMVMFYEVDLKKHATIPQEPKEDEKNEFTASSLDDLNLYEEIEEFEDPELEGSIMFDDLKCTFSNFKSIEMPMELEIKLKSNPKRIISLKSDKKLTPIIKPLLEKVKSMELYDKILYIPCKKINKYKPYGFFYDLVANLYNLSPALKNFNPQQLDALRQFDPQGLLQDLMSLTPKDGANSEAARNAIFDIFVAILNSLQKTLIFIEDFDDIDETSYELLKLVFEHLRSFDITYILTYGKNFSLHGEIPVLLTKYDYSEFTLKTTPFAELFGEKSEYYKKIADSFYVQKLSQLTKGSTLYLDQAISYMKELEVLEEKDGVLDVVRQDAVLLPPNLEELVARRLKNLAKDTPAFEILATLLVTGAHVPIEIVNLLGIENAQVEIDKLVEKGFITINGNCIDIYNYNLYLRALKTTMPKAFKTEFLQKVLDSVYNNDIACPEKAYFYKELEQPHNEFIQWQRLSLLSSSLGDVSSYLACVTEFLKLVDSQVSQDEEISPNDYREEIYETISKVLYKFTPEKNSNIIAIILDSFERSIEDMKIIELCNKLLEGCVINGDFVNALDFANKILARLPQSAIDPESQIYVVGYFLISLIKLEILFSLGKLDDCIEHGESILNLINPLALAKMKPESQTTEEFKELLFNNLCFPILSRIIKLQENLDAYFARIQTSIGELPDNFRVFKSLEELLRSPKTEVPRNIDPDSKNNFVNFAMKILEAFADDFDDYSMFARVIYRAKLNARKFGYYTLEMFCDLILGYSYQKMAKYKKADKIYKNILENALKKDSQIIVQIAWYLLAELNLLQFKVPTAYSVANNAIIHLEKDANSSELILCLLKLSMYKILMAKDRAMEADYCMNYAKGIALKHGLKIKFEDAIKQAQELRSMHNERDNEQEGEQ